MPPLTSNAANFILSRKQQWRRACRAGAKRSQTVHAANKKKETATNGQYTLTTEEVQERIKFRSKEQIQDLAGSSTACNVRATTSTSSPSPEKSPQQVKSRLTPQRTSISTPRCVSSEDSNGDSVKAKRRVCFDSKIRVVLVSTRHELKSKALAHNKKAAGGVTEGGSNDNGIWWTMRDCFEFRRAYRRQIIASGLKCTSLLCPTEIVFLIGAEDDDDNKSKGKCEPSQAAKATNQHPTITTIRQHHERVLPRLPSFAVLLAPADLSAVKSDRRRGLEKFISAFEELRVTRRDLGWGVDEVAMRLTMLSFLRGRDEKDSRASIPPEASAVEEGKEWLGERAAEWERFLRWAHASYGWNEEIVGDRAGFEVGEVEVVALSRGRARNRPLAPNYVLAVDHRRREIVLSVRGSKGFGDAITVTHFRPEPFLDGYAHRGFAQSAHELVREVEPRLLALERRLPGYRVYFTGHSMGGGIAAMASLLLRDRARQRRKSAEYPTSSAARDRCEGAPASNSAASFMGREEGGGGNVLEETAQAASDGPVVVSFATPSCLSLELARSCRPWVSSIVYKDDAVPRLSTVSLELLKEDMRAEEWRRAVDRLSRLQTFLSPTEAAAALKDALRAGPGRVGKGWVGSDRVGSGKDDNKSSSSATGSIISNVYRTGYNGRGSNPKACYSGGANGVGLEDDNGRNRRRLEGAAADGKRTVTGGRSSRRLSSFGHFFRQYISSAVAQTVTRRGGGDQAAAMKSSRGVGFGFDDTSDHHPAAEAEAAATAVINGIIMPDNNAEDDDAGDDGHARSDDSLHRRLDLLHESLLAKREPSLLPLYPPGDIFLACTTSTECDQAKAGGVTAERKGGAGKEFESAHPARNYRCPDGGSSSRNNTDNLTSLSDMGGSGVDIGDITLRSRSRSRSGRGGGDGWFRPPSKARTPAGAGGEIRSDEGWVLVRVPQQHFLRMTLSPTMLTDHTIDSYKKAIAELKRHFLTNPARRGVH